MLKVLKKYGLIFLTLTITQTGFAADYIVDKAGMHAAINFKIKHLGFSWLTGRFNDFEGTFSYDAAKPEASKVSIKINPASIDSNHKRRDLHLRSDEFLNVAKFPTSSFVSKKVTSDKKGQLTIVGDFTLHGVTRPLTILASVIGEGKDPWGGYRSGFTGTTSIRLKDYGIKSELGPASQNVELELHIEGIRQ